MTGSEVVDCKVTIWDGTGFEINDWEDTIQGTVCEGFVRDDDDWEDTIQGTVCEGFVCDDEALFVSLFLRTLPSVWKRMFNLRRT